MSSPRNTEVNPAQAGPLRSPRRNTDEDIGLDQNAIGSHLEIQVEAKNLANMDVFSLSDPFALLESWDDRKWVELGKYQQILLLAYSHLA